MSRSIFAIIAAGALLGTAGAVSTDDEVTARKAALELAGAFSNDGFKMRDGHWSGPIAPGKPQFIQVNLYAGNEYWFSAGATGKAQKLGVSVFDEAGKAVAFEPYVEGLTAAAGFAPEASGPYYVKVTSEGEPTTFCLIYSYK